LVHFWFDSPFFPELLQVSLGYPKVKFWDLQSTGLKIKQNKKQELTFSLMAFATASALSNDTKPKFCNTIEHIK